MKLTPATNDINKTFFSPIYPTIAIALMQYTDSGVNWLQKRFIPLTPGINAIKLFLHN